MSDATRVPDDPTPIRGLIGDTLTAAGVNLSWRCEHPRIELRYKDAVNGVRQYREQCLQCGGLVRQVKKSEVPSELRSSVPPFDEALQQQWWASRLAEYRQQREEQQQQERERWWRQYSDYLKSPEWRARRYLVLQRANGVCEGCESAPATHVHHLNYQHVGDELLFELVAICQPCHQKAHPDKPIGTDD
jgi:5-methylcytosine-specific restriction endonuclease McrA